MTREEVLKKINKYISDEKGNPVTVKDKFIDAELDSLGATIALISLDNEFNLGLEESDFEKIENLTIRELINLCLLKNTNT